MYLHIRETPDGGSIVVTLRESYRVNGKVRKRQHHLGSCPTDLSGDKGWGSAAHHVQWFWTNFDEACERLEVKPKDKREYECRVRAAGMPKRWPRRKSDTTKGGE